MHRDLMTFYLDILFNEMQMDTQFFRITRQYCVELLGRNLRHWLFPPKHFAL